MTALVPLPRRQEPGEGFFDLGAGGAICADPGLERLAALAAEWLEEALALRDAAQTGSAPLAAARVRFDLPEAGGPDGGDGPGGRIRFVHDGSLRGEEYALEIGPDLIRLRAGSRDGAVRAASTLRQLALSEGAKIPALAVEDGPRFSWRGAMLDTARNFFTVDFILRFLDLMALHKMNRFHWHLTDDQAWRLEIPALPELTRYGSRRRDRRKATPAYKEGRYDAADIARVLRHADERGIVVVPEIELPGHALALLASHPELSCRGAAADGGAFEPEDRYGIFEDILCAGNEGVFDLLSAVFDEVARLFPGPWVHAGGDEAPKGRWLACPRCRERMRSLGLRDSGGALDPELLQGWFMDRIARLLAERGKRMIGWDDVLEGGVGEDIIIMSWRGAEGGLAAAKAGREAIMCPQTKACYFDHKHGPSPDEPGNLGVCTVKDVYRFDPIPPGLSEIESSRIMGGQGNLWSEFMYFARHVEYMAFPRLSALSEVLWSPLEKRDFSDFRRRMRIHGARLDLLGVNRYRGPLDPEET